MIYRRNEEHVVVILCHLVSSVCKLLSFVQQLHRLVFSMSQPVSTLPQSHVQPVDYIPLRAPCDALPRLTCGKMILNVMTIF